MCGKFPLGPSSCQSAPGSLGAGDQERGYGSQTLSMSKMVEESKNLSGPTDGETEF